MRLLSTLALGAVISTVVAQNYNLDSLGRLNYQALRNSNLSNLWGWADGTGNEYAIVGVNGRNNPFVAGGVSVVDVTVPTNPQEVFFFPGPPSIWREIKTYGHYAYCTTEADWGLTIIDLSPLPGNTNLPAIVDSSFTWSTSHSLFIDEGNGRLYINGHSDGNGGVKMYDLTADPMAPVYIGEFDQWYVHDCYAHGDTLYNAHIYDGFMSIVDVSDPQNPVLLGTQNTPSNFTHNLWTDDSRDYIFSTDEVDDAWIGSYDISDPQNISEVDRAKSNPGSEAVPHNTYWLHDNLVTSYYSYGVTMHDVSDPTNVIEVGHFDTSHNFDGGGFDGCWGVFPFLPSGRILASDIQEGLYILGPTYTVPCRLEGTVTDQQTTAPINNVQVQVSVINVTDNTALDGTYATGHYQAGTYDVTFSALGYLSTTVTGVQFVSGQTTVVDAQLIPLVAFAQGGTVIEEGTNAPIAGADVMLVSDDFTYTATTDGSGNFNVPAMFAGDYVVTAGNWGHVTVCLPVQQIDQNTGGLIITLPIGWYDDFTFDFGWSEDGDAGTGAWERGEPVGTTSQGDPVNPEEDVNDDCTDQAMVTGNGGGQAGNDDVDDGETVLTSPVFDLTSYMNPAVRYSRWFYNGGGQGAPNDEMIVELSNGTDTVMIDLVDDGSPGMGSWVSVGWGDWAALSPTANMQLIVTIADEAPGHLVEGGLDHFYVQEMSGDGIEEVTALSFEVYPNPSAGVFTISTSAGGNKRLEVLDAQGRAVASYTMTGQLTTEHELATGVYSLRLTDANGHQAVRRLVVR